ncbi:hypothetical protein CsSME_00001324 [Camellia sinensis var. sinensis]
MVLLITSSSHRHYTMPLPLVVSTAAAHYHCHRSSSSSPCMDQYQATANRVLFQNLPNQVTLEIFSKLEQKWLSHSIDGGVTTSFLAGAALIHLEDQIRAKIGDSHSCIVGELMDNMWFCVSNH